MNALETRIQRPLRILMGTVALVGLAAGYCLGRAGGGGGGHASSSHSYSSSHGSYSGGSGSDGPAVLLSLLVVGIMLVAVAVQNFQLKKSLSEKFAVVRNLTTELEQRDPLWNLQAMTTRVNEVFFKVQAA